MDECVLFSSPFAVNVLMAVSQITLCIQVLNRLLLPKEF